MTEKKSTPYRLRFAPSPTGEVHIGSARTSLFDFLFARHNHGAHILRVEDTDQTRYVPGVMDRFLADFAWLGITFDESPEVGGPYGPYIQSERTKLYQDAAAQLLEAGHAYQCWCTPERLTQMREAQMAAKQPPRYDRHCLALGEELRSKNQELGLPYVIRMKVPEGETVFTDLVRGEVRVANKEVDDQVLIKSDGFPTYHLAVVVDDHAMEISHVFRSEEWLPSTPKHLMLCHMLGWEPPYFAHLPVVLNKERRKLSKRKDGEIVWISTYRAQGYLPEALVNYLAFLGWNPGDEREFFTVDELIKEFDLSRVHGAGAIFDPVKLKFINAHYLRQRTDEELLTLLKEGDFIPEPMQSLSDAELRKWVCISHDRIQILADFSDMTLSIFSLSDYPAEQLIFKKSDRATTNRGLELAAKILFAAEPAVWETQETLQNLLADATQKADLTNGDVFWPVRVALSGQVNSPSPAELLWVLGRDESLKRLTDALALLGK